MNRKSTDVAFQPFIFTIYEKKSSLRLRFCFRRLCCLLFSLMSTPGDIHAGAKPNGHADDGDFCCHHVRRPFIACSSGTATDGNSFYFSETELDTTADGSLPVVIPRGCQRLDFTVLPGSVKDEVDMECGELELNLQNDGEERGIRCRICHSNFEGNCDDRQGDEDPSGVRVELGCSCKGDLGVAHKHCAETWFEVKGNPICEICGAIALNFIVELENEAINIEVASQTSVASSEAHGFKHGHLVLTFMITFMVFTFAISYIFHVKNLNRED